MVESQELSTQAEEQQAAALVQKLADASTRYSAVEALQSLGVSASKKYVGDIISTCLADQDCATRLVAASTLGSVADAVMEAGGIDKVLELLKSEHPGVRCAAATTLGKMGPAAVKYAREVAALLNDEDEDLSELYLSVGGGQARSPSTARRPKCAALLALGAMGATQFAALMSDSLRDEIYEVRLAGLEGIALLGEAGRAEAHRVANCLEDDVFLVRRRACEVIAALKAEDQMGAMPELFEDPAPSVRAAALNTLATAPAVAEGYSNEVFKCMTDEIPAVRAAAIKTLGVMGETGQSYASVIATNLEDQDPSVRSAACEALGKLGQYGAAFAEELQYCLQDEYPEVRDAAVAALNAVGQVSGGGSAYLTDA